MGSLLTSAASQKRVSILLPLLIAAACSAEETPKPNFETWVTEPEYQFGGAPRNLQFEPHRLTARLVAETVNRYVEATADFPRSDVEAAASRHVQRGAVQPRIPSYGGWTACAHCFRRGLDTNARARRHAEDALCGTSRRHERGASPRASASLAAGQRRHRHPCLGRLARLDGRASRRRAKAGCAGTARVEWPPAAFRRCRSPVPGCRSRIPPQRPAHA